MKATLLHWLRALLLAGACMVLAGWAFGESLPGSLPLRRDPEGGAAGGIWTPSLLLLGLAVAAGGYAWWRRGAAQASSPGRRADAAVTRLSSQPLTPHASVHAVQWNGEEFLLACTAQQVTVLARRPADRGEGGAS